MCEIFCQTVKYTTQEFIDKRHKEHHQKLNKVRQKIKKIEKLRPQEITDKDKEDMDNLKEQEQELLKYRAEKLREKIKIPIVEEKEWDISYLNKVYRTRVNENNVYELKNEAGELKEGISEIIDIIETYYLKLYKKEQISPSAQDRLLRNIHV